MSNDAEFFDYRVINPQPCLDVLLRREPLTCSTTSYPEITSSASEGSLEESKLTCRNITDFACRDTPNCGFRSAWCGWFVWGDEERRANVVCTSKRWWPGRPIAAAPGGPGAVRSFLFALGLSCLFVFPGGVYDVFLLFWLSTLSSSRITSLTWPEANLRFLRTC